MKWWNRTLNPSTENYRTIPIEDRGIKLVPLLAAPSDLLAPPPAFPREISLPGRTGMKRLCIPKGVWRGVLQQKTELKEFFSIGNNRCATGTKRGKRLAAKRQYDPSAFTGVRLDLSGAGADDDLPDEHPGAAAAVAEPEEVGTSSTDADARVMLASPEEGGEESPDEDREVEEVLLPGQEDGAMETPDHVEEFDSEDESEAEGDREEVVSGPAVVGGAASSSAAPAAGGKRPGAVGAVSNGAASPSGPPAKLQKLQSGAAVPGAASASPPRQNDASIDWRHVQMQLNFKIIIEFQDLLRRMMDFDKNARITPEDAMDHDFFKTLNFLRRWSDTIVDAREEPEE